MTGRIYDVGENDTMRTFLDEQIAALNAADNDKDSMKRNAIKYAAVICAAGISILIFRYIVLRDKK